MNEQQNIIMHKPICHAGKMYDESNRWHVPFPKACSTPSDNPCVPNIENAAEFRRKKKMHAVNITPLEC